MTKDGFIGIMKGLRYIKEADQKDEQADGVIGGLIDEAWDLLSNSTSSRADECKSEPIGGKDGMMTLHNLMVFLLAIENIYMP